jgi:hypothetical protein
MTLSIYNIAETAHVDVDLPHWPYDMEIHMPIVISKASDGTYPANGFFDPPDEDDPPNYGTYDYRILNIPSWKLSATQKTALNAFLRDPTMGRGENFIIRQGATSTGFYSCGADYIDHGDTIVRVLEDNQGGVLSTPYKWFEDQLKFIIVTPPATASAPTGYDEGEFYIGSCPYGFKMPQNEFSPESTYNLQTGISINGTPNSLDGPLSSDSWETTCTIECTTANAYYLITELLSKRTADIDILVDGDWYPFGADWPFGGSYTCKFLGSEMGEKEIVLRATHVGYDRWEIPLHFWWHI